VTVLLGVGARSAVPAAAGVALAGEAVAGVTLVVVGAGVAATAGAVGAGVFFAAGAFAAGAGGLAGGAVLAAAGSAAAGGAGVFFPAPGGVFAVGAGVASVGVFFAAPGGVFAAGAGAAGEGVFFAAGAGGGLAAGLGGLSASADGATTAAPMEAHISVATAFTRARGLFGPSSREAPTSRHHGRQRREHLSGNRRTDKRPVSQTTAGSTQPRLTQGHPAYDTVGCDAATSA
jgi:hypothetical protein